MAAVVTITNRSRLGGGSRIHVGTIAFDDSYPTGGEAVAVNDLGLNTLTALFVAPSAGYQMAWDGSASSPKVVARWVDTTVDGAPMAEVTAATNLSALTAVPFIAVGR